MKRLSLVILTFCGHASDILSKIFAIEETNNEVSSFLFQEERETLKRVNTRVRNAMSNLNEESLQNWHYVNDNLKHSNGREANVDPEVKRRIDNCLRLHYPETYSNGSDNFLSEVFQKTQSNIMKYLSQKHVSSRNFEELLRNTVGRLFTIYEQDHPQLKGHRMQNLLHMEALFNVQVQHLKNDGRVYIDQDEQWSIEEEIKELWEVADILVQKANECVTQKTIIKMAPNDFPTGRVGVAWKNRGKIESKYHILNTLNAKFKNIEFQMEH